MEKETTITEKIKELKVNREQYKKKRQLSYENCRLIKITFFEFRKYNIKYFFFNIQK